MRTQARTRAMIGKEEYIRRMEQLQAAVRAHGLDLYLVSAEASIYYLTGVVYMPLERPFFVLVRPAGAASLLV
ncbi:MAG: hypothetical protein EHM56_07555, partial [Chloroflexi bacterium]